MAKYICTIGFRQDEETSPGIWDEVISERQYVCDILQNIRRYETGDKIHDDLTVTNTFSIVADAYAFQNFFAMRYVTWMGTKWKINTVEVLRPRLRLTVGGVYNGPEPRSEPEGPSEEVGEYSGV